MSMAAETDEPIRLVEDTETGDRFLIYEASAGPRLDIKFAGETLWMTQAQIAELFGRDVSVVSRHVANILLDGELDESTSLQKMQTSHGRPAVLYNLDMVISVGYRVSSVPATLFRRWATGILVQYAKAGFVVDARRLKNPDNADRVAELRDIIRDIRSDEANVYRELKRICSMCRDYDPKSDRAREFYQRTQAKLIHAVTSHTPSEIIAERANYRAENMGLTNWPRDSVRKADIAVSKNYLADGEIRELNRLTTILLDIFEDQLEVGRIVIMDDATALLDRQLANLGRAVLRSGGAVSASDAKRKAEAEYQKFDTMRKLERMNEADDHIAELARQAKDLPKPRRN